MGKGGLVVRRSRTSNSLTASWICEAVVTYRVKGVTRLSECCSTPRVPAYTFLAPRRSASSRSARPIPRFAPVTKIVLFEMFISNVLPSLTTVPASRKIRALFNDWCAGVVKPAEGVGSLRQNSVVFPHVRVLHESRSNRSFGSGAFCFPDDGRPRIFHGRSSVITDGSTTSGKETISYETSDDALSRCNSCSGWRLCGRHDYRSNAYPAPIATGAH